MTRTKHRNSRGLSQKHSGILAGLTVVVAVGFLYFNFDPTVAGADTSGKTTDVAKLAAAIQVAPKPPASTAISTSLASLPSASLAVPQSASAKKNTPAVTQADRLAMLMNLVLLEQGRRKLSDAADYTCTFYKQERIGEELLEGQFIELKMRTKPLSIYMKWLSGEKGRELLYVDGEQDNKMIVHPGGWKARLVPALKIDPDGALALRETRHPVTMVGLVKLCDEIIGRRKAEIEHQSSVLCQFTENEKIDDRPCYGFTAVYLDRKSSEEYRKSVQYVDKERLLPICVKNYSWPDDKQTFADEAALDEATLIEHYAYSELQFNQQLANEDFDRANSSYNFRR